MALSRIKTNSIANDAVTSTKIAPNTVVASDIAALSIDSTKLASSAVTISKVDSTVTQLFGMRNRIINGDMRIDQRNAGASVSTASATSGYTVDRWQFSVSEYSKVSFQQNAGSVTPPVGFMNYLGATSASAFSVASGDYFTINHKIEGYNTADLGFGTANAKTVTLSFWVRSSLTGTFGAVINNSDNTRAYPINYTISSANTWEYKTVTFTGDTGGTWQTGNLTGIQIRFGLGVGSTYSGTAGAWTGTANILGATGGTSVVGTSGATFYVTGVQFEVGTQATTFDYRDYGTELVRCQRYYAKISSTSGNGAVGSGIARSSTASNVYIKLPVTMRTIPTVPATSTLYLNYNSDVYQAVVSDSGIQGGTDSINYFPNSSTASMTTGYPVILAIGSGGYISFSAEL